MKKNLWFSKAEAELSVGKGGKVTSDHEDGENTFIINNGYCIGIDKFGNCYQYSQVRSAYLEPPEGEQELVVSLNDEDFDVIVLTSGEVNTTIAKKHGIEPDIDLIKSRVLNFYEPIGLSVKDAEIISKFASKITLDGATNKSAHSTVKPKKLD